MRPHDHDHPHDRAPDRDGPPTYYQVMEAAVRELLIGKGVLTAAEIREAVEKMDARTPAQGARVVARAWTDPAFKARLLADGSAACQELGIEMGPTCRIDTLDEVDYYLHGGILPYVLRQLLAD